uniref:Uncharacterized protein n=1 Tax=Kalanchoe fedtschenkoi TaxID=63787 RepID=A0A7N0T5W0_KALFE
MKALHVLAEDAPPVVETFWDGEIVDTRNFSFHSEKMSVRPEVDMQYWSKFQSFSQFAVQTGFEGCQWDLSKNVHIYMRWYERSDKNPGSYYDISSNGFYYVCVSCLDGSIEGVCYDPTPTGGASISLSFMKFVLETVNEGRSGFSSSSYELQ